MSSSEEKEPDKGDCGVPPVDRIIDNKETRRKPRMGRRGLMVLLGVEIAAEPVPVLRPGL